MVPAGGGIDGGGGRFIMGERDLSGADSVGEGNPSIVDDAESARADGRPSVGELSPTDEPDSPLFVTESRAGGALRKS
jgi:hypothetical protein